MLYTSWGVSGTPDEGDDTASCTQRQQTSNDFRGLATPKGGGRELKMTSLTPHPLAPSMEPPLYSVRKWRATTFVDSSSFSRFCPTLEEASAETRPRVSVHADREIRRVIASMNSASIFLHSPSWPVDDDSFTVISHCNEILFTNSTFKTNQTCCRCGLIRRLRPSFNTKLAPFDDSLRAALWMLRSSYFASLNGRVGAE